MVPEPQAKQPERTRSSRTAPPPPAPQPQDPAPTTARETATFIPPAIVALRRRLLMCLAPATSPEQTGPPAYPLQGLPPKTQSDRRSFKHSDPCGSYNPASQLCISMKNFFKNPQTSTLMDRKLSGYWPGDACPTLGFSLPSHRASFFTPKPNFFYTLDYDDWLPRSLIPNSEPVTGNRHRSTLMAEDKCKEREVSNQQGIYSMVCGANVFKIVSWKTVTHNMPLR